MVLTISRLRKNSVVIPGRPFRAEPGTQEPRPNPCFSSRCSWVPGSLAALRPRNDGGLGLFQHPVRIEERNAMRKAVACCLAVGAVILLGQSAQAQLLQTKALSLEAARKMVRAAEAEAERNQWRGVVAVVDEGGWLILLERMDHPAMTVRRAGGGQGAQRGALQETHPSAGGRDQPRPLRRDHGSGLHRDARRTAGRGRRRGDRRHRCHFCDTRGRRPGRQGRARRAPRVIGSGSLLRPLNAV
jgi:hypothetical protein